MFPIPGYPHQTASVIGIDPGTETMGVCRIEFDIDNLSIVRITPITFRGSRLVGTSRFAETHGERFEKNLSHLRNLTRVFEEIHPVIIGSESPFINMRMPAAFAALVENVNTIKQAVFEYDLTKQLYLIPPSNVKKAVGALGNAKKEEVASAISKIPEIVNALTIPFCNLDEHSRDATAVGYALIKMLRNPERNLY